MQVVHKTAAGKVAGSLTYVLSDDTLDRMGDIIEPSGWKLAQFRENPIALFGHQSGFPIGNWNNVRVEGRKLIGELEPARKGTSARVDEIISLIEQGILRATSVGFQPIKSEPLNPKDPFGGVHFLEQELLETSIVSVPANPAALQLAKSLKISDETMSLAFGEHAAMRHRDLAMTGKHAATTPAEQERSRADRPPRLKEKSMSLSQIIEGLQSDLNVKRDKLVELNAAEEFDNDAVEEMNGQIDAVERELATRKASEAKIGTNAASAAGVVKTVAVVRRPLGFPQKEVNGLDLLVRALTVRGIARFGDGKSIDQVLDERYPGHEATAIVTKADQTVGTTTVAGWALELNQTAYAAFMDALVGRSIYPDLRSRGPQYSFDGNGTVSIPSRTAGGAGGGFVAEGAPIRVGRITTAATTMVAKKLGVIVPFTRELAKRSTPAIEGIVRQAIVDDTSVILDSALLDATAVSTARPAGLLNGVSAIASGFGGGDYQAVIEDINALMAPFDTANASDGITLIMHPKQARKLMMMPGPDGTFGWQSAFMNEFTIVRSTHATAGRIIALRNADFVTASGDAPEFDVSEQATVHMEDTTPLELVSAGGTVADPTRSFFQTATIGVRMIMDIGWQMRRSGMVQWIDGTSW